jgi:hypothetical protein
MTGSVEGLLFWSGAGALVAAAALSGVLLVALNPLLRRYALARPNARSSHRQPTPQGGGIAVIVSTILVTVACAGALGDTYSGAGSRCRRSPSRGRLPRCRQTCALFRCSRGGPSVSASWSALSGS